MPPTWLAWAQRIQAIAQSGITYSDNQYDLERYEALREIAAEILAAGANTAIEPIRDLLSAQSGYATPKVDMRAALIRDDKILLVQERADGGWSLPGGWADVGESPSHAVVREVREESGYETRAVKLIALDDRNLHGHPPFPFHAFKVFFLCELVSGEPVLSYEITGIDWFAEDNLPTLSLTRVTEPQIHRCFAHYREPDLPTEFD